MQRRSRPDPTTQQVQKFLEAGCPKSALLVAYRPVFLAMITVAGAGGLATALVKWIS